jgi:sugar lactone lactonase YvrE
MKTLLSGVGLAFAGVLLYLLFWPVPVEPVAWDAPVDLGLRGVHAPNDRLAKADGIPLGKHEGPEDVTLGHDGRLYATSKDGHILQILPDGSVQEFARAGGRPLGIEAAADGSLIVANAYIGLQRISTAGEVETILTGIGGQPLRYADDLAIAANGTIYFSDASTKFGAREYSGTYEGSLLDILEHGGHGRIIAFEPSTGATEVIMDGLNFANGVAISEDQTYLLIAETGSYRILRYWLQGEAAGSTDFVIDNLPGFPDNINNGLQGRFWIGLGSPRSKALDDLSSKPFLRKLVQRLPSRMRPQAAPSAHVIAISGDGDVLMDLQDSGARYPSMTGVLETPDALYLTRLFGKHLPVLKKENL